MAGQDSFDAILQRVKTAPTLTPSPAPSPSLQPMEDEPDGNEYDRLIKTTRGAQRVALQSSLGSAALTTPDRAADVLRISEATGFPSDLVARNYDALKARESEQAQPYAQMLRQTPKTAEYLSQPENAAVSHDDMEQLGFVEWLFTAPGRALQRGMAQTRFAELSAKALMGGLTLQERTDMAEARELMNSGGALGAGDSWFKGAIVGAFEQLPNTFGATLEGVKLGAPGAVAAGSAAALAGQLGPQVALPEELVSVPLAMRLGGRAGFLAGAAKFGFNMEAGLAYDEFLGMRDELGRPMDAQAARAAALAAGVLNAGLEAFGVEKALETIPGVKRLKGTALRGAIQQALRVPTVRRALADAFKGYTKALAAESAVEVAQRAVTILSGELGKYAAGFDQPPGMLAPGNVDLTQQPTVQNPDGSVSTVDSLSVEVDGKEVLIPTVTPDGRHLSAEQALEEFKTSGRNLGTFADAKSANEFAERIHQDYAVGKYQPGTGAFRSFADIRSDLWNEFTGAIQSFALGLLPGPVTGVLIDVNRARQAQYNEKFFQAMGEGIAQSKTAERLPEQMQKFVADVTKGGPIEDVYAPIDTWTKYWQDQKIDPREIAAEVTGDVEAYDEAIRLGTDLKIPTARYATKLAGTEHNRFFARELRLDPVAMNARESEAFTEQVKSIRVESAEPGAADEVRRKVVEQLLAAGMRPADAEHQAALYEAFFGRMAERAGVDPVALYSRYGLTVTREGLRNALLDRPGDGQQAAGAPGAQLSGKQASDAPVGAQAAVDGATLPADGEPDRTAADAGGRDGLPGGDPERLAAQSAGAGASGDQGGSARAQRSVVIPAERQGQLAALIAEARARGFTGTDQQLTDAFADRLSEAEAIARDVAEHEADSEDNGRDLLQAVADAGGFSIAAEEGGMSAELANIKAALRDDKGQRVNENLAGNAGLPGIPGIVRAQGGKSADIVLASVRENPAFADRFDNLSDFLQAVTEAALTESGVMKRRGESPISIDSTLQMLGVIDGRDWWLDAGAAAVDESTAPPRAAVSESEAAADWELAKSAYRSGEMATEDFLHARALFEAREREFGQAVSDDDYRGEHRPSGPDGGAPASDLTGGGAVYPDDVYGPNGARYYGDGANDARDAATLTLLRSLRGKPSASITIYRAVPKLEGREDRIEQIGWEKSYILKRGKVPPNVRTSLSSSGYYDQIHEELEKLKSATDESEDGPAIGINAGDWVTINRQYAKEHGESALGGAYKIVSKRVRADEIFTSGDSLQEWGYWPKTKLKQERRGFSREPELSQAGDAREREFGQAALDEETWRSPEMQASDTAYEAAFAEFQRATAAYQARTIGDTEYLEARRAFEGAQADRDQVRAGEDKRFRAAKREAKAQAVKDALAADGQQTLFQRNQELTQDDLNAFSQAEKAKFPSLQGFSLVRHDNGDVFLESLIVARESQREGVGSSAMRDLAEFADSRGVRVVLTPAQPGDIGPREPTSTGRLVKFYKRFGFVENTGRKADHEISETMYREPKTKLKQERRGFIRFGANRQMNIALLAKADQSTFLHETGHFFLEVFGDLADNLIDTVQPADMTEEQRRLLMDYASMLKALGVDDRHQVGEKEHETFARSFEAWLGEGKAPSPELQPAFNRFKAWLLGVYRTLLKLRVELNHETRAVLARMFASDEAIAEAEEAGRLTAMILTPDQVKMTPEAFAHYRRAVADASDKARTSLDVQLLAEVQRVRTEEWERERDATRAAVVEELNRDQTYAAMAAMRKGTRPDGTALVEGEDAVPMKLSRGIIVALFGEDRLKTLPKPYVYTSGDGMDPREVATLFGFSSADDLLRAVATATPYREMVERETDRRMLAEHGSLLLDGSLAERAQEAAASEDRDLVLREEMRALLKLQKQVGPFVNEAIKEQEKQAEYERRWFEAEKNLAVAIAQGKKQVEIDKLKSMVRGYKSKARRANTMITAAMPSAETLRDVARIRAGMMTVRELKPARFWSGLVKAGERAQQLLARGDIDGAIVAKQQQLINMALYREVSRQARDLDARVTKARSFATEPVRKRIGLAGGSYLDQIDAILDQFSFVPLSQRELDRVASLQDWVASQTALGYDVNLSARVMDRANKIQYQELSVDELTGVLDSIDQIAHLARLKNKLLKAQDQREFEAERDALEESIYAHNAKRPTIIEPKDTAARTVSGWFASHSKIATLARMFDGHVDGGKMWELFIRPLNEAADSEQIRLQDEAAAIEKIFTKHFTPAERARFSEKQLIGAIDDSISKEGILSIALNWGNETSRDRILNDPDTRWSREQVLAILDTLEKRDWDFVQDVWSYVNRFWPEIAAKQKRVTGVEPEKVAAAVVDTKFGQYAGGYYPLQYDKRKPGSERAGDHEAANQAKLAVAGAYLQTTTRRGHVETRVSNVKLSVRFELGVLFNHVQSVVHDLTHHEAIIDVTRVFRDPKIAAAMRSTHGDQVRDQFRSAFQDIALGQAGQDSANDKALNWMRQASQVAGLGYNLWTAVQQPLGIFNGMSRVGPKWVARGMARWLRDASSMESTTKWIAERSPFMRSRVNTATQDIHDLRSQLKTAGGWFDVLVRKVSNDVITQQRILDSYMWHIGIMQRVADVPTWLGAYEKAMADPANASDENRAVALADQAVIDSQGSGHIKDLAEVQRGPAWAKIFMTFYSYGNTMFNSTKDVVGQTNFRSASSVTALLGHLSLLYVMPAFAATMLRAVFKGDEPEDAADFLKKVAGELFGTVMNEMVVVRELSAGAKLLLHLDDGGNRGYQGPAGLRPIVAFYRFAEQVSQGEVDEALAKSLNAAAGVLFRYPAQQVERTVDGALALADGETQNPFALLMGAPKKASGQ